MSENTQTAQKSLNTYQLASYGAPSMPLSMVSLPLAVYLTPVYADSAGFGLSLAFVGLMLALSRVFDGITDPVIGFLSDRVRTRWGRRKPFVLIGMPIFMLGVWLLWIPPIEFTEVTWLGMTFNTGYPYLLGVLVRGLFYVEKKWLRKFGKKTRVFLCAFFLIIFDGIFNVRIWVCRNFAKYIANALLIGAQDASSRYSWRIHTTPLYDFTPGVLISPAPVGAHIFGDFPDKTTTIHLPIWAVPILWAWILFLCCFVYYVYENHDLMIFRLKIWKCLRKICCRCRCCKSVKK